MDAKPSERRKIETVDEQGKKTMTQSLAESEAMPVEVLAQKIEQHERKKQMKKEEKEDPYLVAAFKDPEISRAFSEMTTNAANIMKYQDNPKVLEIVGRMIGNYQGDPDLLEALSDPEFSAAFYDIATNPANLVKYQYNLKVMKFFTKMAQIMSPSGI